MRFVIALSLLLAVPALAAPADESAACTARHAEISKQAATFNGDARTKRLIDADLKRALRERHVIPDAASGKAGRVHVA